MARSASTYLCQCLKGWIKSTGVSGMVLFFDWVEYLNSESTRYVSGRLLTVL